MSHLQDVVCPGCKQKRFRRITGIVFSGITKTDTPVMQKFDTFGEKNSFWYETTQTSYHTSALAERLKPPAFLSENLPIPTKPRMSAPAPVESIESYVIANMRTKTTLGILIVVFSVLFSVSLSLRIFSLSNQISYPIIGICALGIIGLIYGIQLIATARYNKNISEYIKKMPISKQENIRRVINERASFKREAINSQEREYTKKIERINLQRRAQERYTRLVYCEVCDGIFDPEAVNLGVVSPELKEKLLFRH